ncbi:MAG: translation initiation factor IF-1 [Candidatus Bipolaricaulia bacterium]
MITQKGQIVAEITSFTYKVKLSNGHEVLCYPSGRMRRYHIRILPGDTVTVELSPHDLSRGRIVYRN